MVEVLLYNLSRLHDFWPLLLDHIVELLSDNRAPARLAAIEALSRALIGALAACLQANTQVCTGLGTHCIVWPSLDRNGQRPTTCVCTQSCALCLCIHIAASRTAEILPVSRRTLSERRPQIVAVST